MGCLDAALVFGAMGVLVALWRIARGPSLRPTVIEITDDELVFTLPSTSPRRRCDSRSSGFDS